MPKIIQHILVFIIALTAQILCKLFLPQAILIPAIVFGLYVSFHVMTQERIGKIVAFIMGKRI